MPSDDTQSKRSHANGNIAHRERKAGKLRDLIEQIRPLPGRQVLEVGAGAAVISRSLARAVGHAGTVTAVDVVDECVVHGGYRFLQVNDTTLPFADASFDIVVSNYVIDHVGGRGAQTHHLREIIRALRSDSVFHLAVPNLWSMIEPHYKLAFLSWQPRRLRTPYLRLANNGTYYACEPISHSALTTLLSDVGFRSRQMTFDALRVMRDVESPSGAARLVLGAPQLFLHFIYPIIPPLVLILATDRTL